MLRSSRTHALALAAFVLFAGGAAGARQYLNSGSPPGSVSMGVVPEVNDAAVSDANPLPVKVPGGGSVTPAGTSGSQAQAVQGINGGVPVGVSAASLPLPTGAATETTQQGVATSNAAINAATGTQADTATTSGTNTTIIGALRAIRDRLFATINVNGNVGISQTTPGVTNGVVVNSSVLPTGAATAGNQATEIASLASIAQRAIIYNDAANQTVAANALQNFPIHDLGAAPAYSKTNAAYFSSVAGTAQLLQCQDSGCAVAFIVSSQAVSAGQFATLTAPAFARYYRAAFQAGGTAGTVSVSVSATAN